MVACDRSPFVSPEASGTAPPAIDRIAVETESGRVRDRFVIHGRYFGRTPQVYLVRGEDGSRIPLEIIEGNDQRLVVGSGVDLPVTTARKDALRVESEFGASEADVVLLQGEQGPVGPAPDPAAVGAVSEFQQAVAGALKADPGFVAQATIGPTGATGPQGLVGPTGPEGPAGVIGPQGIQGPIGPIGPTGGIGPVGPTGPQGLEGPLGPTGPEGPAGPGASVLYWTTPSGAFAGLFVASGTYPVVVNQAGSVEIRLSGTAAYLPPPANVLFVEGYPTTTNLNIEFSNPDCTGTAYVTGLPSRARPYAITLEPELFSVAIVQTPTPRWSRRTWANPPCQTYQIAATGMAWELLPISLPGDFFPTTDWTLQYGPPP